MTRRAVVLALALAVVATAAGCGGNDRTRRFDDPVVSGAAVDRYPAGSPARSLLEGLRALQFNVPTTLATFIAPNFHVTAARLNPGIAVSSRVAARLGTPRVLSVRQSGDHAVVTIALGATGTGRVRMVRVADHWAVVGLGR